MHHSYKSKSLLIVIFHTAMVGFMVQQFLFKALLKPRISSESSKIILAPIHSFLPASASSQHLKTPGTHRKMKTCSHCLNSASLLLSCTGPLDLQFDSELLSPRRLTSMDIITQAPLPSGSGWMQPTGSTGKIQKVRTEKVSIFPASAPSLLITIWKQL